MVQGVEMRKELYLPVSRNKRLPGPWAIRLH